MISNNLYNTFAKLTFAGDNRPELRLEEIYYLDKVLDVLVIEESNADPIYLTQAPDSYSSLISNIYTRYGDTNTPRNESADYDTVKKLWEIHFIGRK